MRLARAVPISKKGSTDDIRPLAVGECFRRLLSKGLCAHIGVPTIERRGGDLQFACGTPSGTDVAGILPRLRLEISARHPDDDNQVVLLGIDCKSAFQHVDRYLMLEKVLQYLPEAYGAALNLYHGDSLLLLHHNPDEVYATAVSEQGVHQGCVFGTIFFSIAIRDLVAELRERLR